MGLVVQDHAGVEDADWGSSSALTPTHEVVGVVAPLGAHPRCHVPARTVLGLECPIVASHDDDRRARSSGGRSAPARCALRRSSARMKWRLPSLAWPKITVSGAPWATKSRWKSPMASASRATGTATSSMMKTVPDGRMAPALGARPLRRRQCSSRSAASVVKATGARSRKRARVASARETASRSASASAARYSARSAAVRSRDGERVARDRRLGIAAMPHP